MAAVVTAAQFEAATLHDKYNVLQIVQHLQKVAPRQPVIGVICGSGLSELHEILTDRVTLPYATIPGFPQSTVQGQVGELVFGFLDGKSVVLMRGRFHFYEGYDPKLVSLPVRVFAALGVRALVVTNASGGVNPVYNIGDFMILQDHMSFPGLSGVSPLIGENDVRFGPRFPAIGPVYSPVLQNIAFKKAEELGLSARMRLGTYVGVAGPTYETPHEIAAMRVLGGDAVGMSTVPEIVQAAHCGLPILGLALISNRCKGPKDTVPNPTHQEVLDSVNAASKDIKTLVAAVIAELDVSGFPAPMASELFALHGAAAAAKVAAAAAATAPSGCPVSGKGAAAPVCDSPCAAPSPICASTIAGAIAGALAATILFTLAKRK